MTALFGPLAFAAGLWIGGNLADASTAVLVLFTGCMSLGAFLGGLRAWLTTVEPDWAGSMASGTIYGGIAGILLALVDAYMR